MIVNLSGLSLSCSAMSVTSAVSGKRTSERESKQYRAPAGGAGRDDNGTSHVLLRGECGRSVTHTIGTARKPKPITAGEFSLYSPVWAGENRRRWVNKHDPYSNYTHPSEGRQVEWGKYGRRAV